MIRKLPLLGLVAATISPMFGQTPIPATATVPDYVLFRFFFIHLARLQSSADALKAQGKKDLSMRNLIKRQAKLTDKEYANLLSVAAGCNAAYATQSMNGAAAAQQIKQQYPISTQQFPSVSAVPQAAAQQFSALEVQRQQVVTNWITGLQSQMTQARFQVLYNYVVAAEGPRIKQGPISQAVQN